MEQNFTFFCIYDCFEIINLKSEDICISKPINYFIKSSYNGTSSSGHTIYYYHGLFDENFNSVLNNKMVLNGIDCVLEEKEFWGVPFYRQNYHTTVIRVNIIDKEKIEKKINFKNNGLVGDGLKKVFKYLKILDKKSTHVNSEYDLKNLVRDAQ